MSKDHISTGINQRLRKWPMLCRRSISPIWPPVCRDNEEIDGLFCPSHSIAGGKRLHGTERLHPNRGCPPLSACVSCVTPPHSQNQGHGYSPVRRHPCA